MHAFHLQAHAGAAQRGADMSGSSLGRTLRDLWSVRKQLSLGMGLMFLQQVIGINTIMYYSGSILKQAHIGNDSTVIWLTGPVACGQLVGCFIGMALIDNYGRRPLVRHSPRACS